MTAATRPGEARQVATGVLCVLAPNPSPMTGPGTNSYIVGDSDLAVIDPGPDLPAHRAALLRAIAGRKVRAVVVTHAHRDHADLAVPLARAVGAPVVAFGDAEAGRSAAMSRLAARGLAGSGEGVATGFAPDQTLADGATLSGNGWQLEAIHTPGHFGNHISLLAGRLGFSGDLVMGWASTLISPPDGDLGDFRASCARLRARGPSRLLPGHGAPVEDPAARIDWLLAHRATREEQILRALARAPGSPADLTRRIYVDTPRALHPAAERNVLAHLVDLWQRGHIAATPALTETARYALSPDEDFAARPSGRRT